ncbi:MAG: S41 family peptidase [Chitinophagales bacterium]
MIKEFKPLNVLALLLFSIISLSFAASRSSSSQFEISKNLDIFATMFKELDMYYVDEVDPEKLIRTGIDAMLNSLDPYTTFYSEEDMEGYRMQTTGKYGGIGALIRRTDDYVIISEPYEDFPAFKAGLIAGDKILEIDGVPAKGKSTDEVSKMLKGKPGTSVELTIERFGDGNPIVKNLTRDEVKIKNVPYYGLLEDKKTGYIRLGNFTEDCSKEVSNALKELKKTHNIESVVLDLRGNPGGLLNEAISVANIFVDKGQEIVSTKGRKQEWSNSYKSKQVPVDLEIPLAVLVDRGSASASEIVAGVIQDLDRGIIIGQRSFGKGLVQTTKVVGYNSKVKLTTAKYYLPSGRCIQAIDYSGGYNDNLEKISDTLRTAFKTKNGRKVYDAGGVDPDIKTELDTYANISQSLMGKQLIFLYVNEYRLNHPTIPTPDKFELVQADYDDFVKFVGDKDYDYTTSSERLLKDLEDSAKEEKYLEVIQEDLDNLTSKIKHDKQKDLYKFQEEVEQLLEYEIVSRYFYQTGRIQESLEDTKEIKAALEVFADADKYKQLLKGN